MLDVWENEPNIRSELLDQVDLGTPHIAGHSFDGKVNGTVMIYEAACRHLGVPAPWRPVLPAPPVPRLVVTMGQGEDEEDVLRRIIRKVYSITADDARLRSGFQEFEKLRTEYPVRREFFNTELMVPDSLANLREKFTALGFRCAVSPGK